MRDGSVGLKDYAFNYFTGYRLVSMKASFYIYNVQNEREYKIFSTILLTNYFFDHL